MFFNATRVKNLLFIFFFALTINVFAQKNEDVSLTVNGDGQTKEEALQNALRKAIEQAFGTFISSNTQILNDRLIKDEIVSISNGNIKKYDILSEIQLYNGRYNTTVKAMVSLSKLTTFCKNKGVSIEFEGALYASNIKLQLLYKNNEKEAIGNLMTVLKNIVSKCFDYSINSGEPTKVFSNSDKYYQISISVAVSSNSNLNQLYNILIETLNALTIPKNEESSLTDVGKKVYPLSVQVDNKKYSYKLRSDESRIALTDFFSNTGTFNYTYDLPEPPDNIDKYIRNFIVTVVKSGKEIKIDGQSRSNNNGIKYSELASLWDNGKIKHERSDRWHWDFYGSIPISSERDKINLTNNETIASFSYNSYLKASNQTTHVNGIVFTLDEIGTVKGFKIKPNVINQ